MSRTDIVAGLDVGTTKVCMIIAEGEPGGALRVIGEGLVPSDGMRKGVVTDIEKTSHAIAQAAEKAQRVAGVLVSSVFVGVSGEHIRSMNSKGIVAIAHPRRMVRQEDVDRVIESSRLVVLPPEREIIHAIPRGFCIDGQDGIRSPVGMSGSRLEVETHIVHGQSSFLQNLAKCVDRAGLEIESFVLQSFAAARAVLDEADRSLGVALVDMGGGTTDVAVYQNDSIVHSAVVAVGGAHLDQDVAIGLQCSLSAAEQLKIQAGCSSVDQVDASQTISVQRTGAAAPSQLPRRLLAEILEPRMTEIFQLVGETIEQYTPLRSLPGGIVLTGGTSLLSGVTALGERLLGVPVRPGRVSGVGGLMDSVSDPQHATGVGLALCAWDQRVSEGALRNSGKLRGPRAWLGKVRDALMGTD